MSALDQIVDIVITQQTAAIPQPSFSIPLIVGPNATSVLKYYTSAAALLTDGFTTSDIEYVYAVELMEQALTPVTFGVGERTTAVKQVDTLAVNTLTTAHAYHFTLNGILITYTSSGGDTQQSILTALNAAIATAFPTNPPVTYAVTGTGSGALDTLTASIFGAGFTIAAIDSQLTHVAVTPNNGIADDLNAIVNATNGNLWYGMVLCSNQSYDILQTASFIEATGNRIFVAASNDSNIPTSLTTDLASQLKALSYARTALMYSASQYNKGMDAAWLGGQLPQTPGASTWANKTLVGITAEPLTASQYVNLIGTPGVNTGKNVNVYSVVGATPITQTGIMVGGQFIDVTVFIDWLKATMQNAVFAQLVLNPKIPYTDKGLAVIENQVLNVLKQGSDDGGTGGIDATTIKVSAVPVASIAANSRAMRYVPSGSIKWSCRLTGAFHNVVVNGTVSV